MLAEQGMYGIKWAGCPVFTRDGDELGEVEEKWDGYFKVDALDKPDYWLPTDAAELADDGRIILSFDAEQLDDYWADDPFKLKKAA